MSWTTLRKKDGILFGNWQEGGEIYEAAIEQLKPGHIRIHPAGYTSFDVTDEKWQHLIPQDTTSLKQQGDISSQIPGKIVATMIKPGDEVTVGSPLLIIEAMKMENEIRAEIDGRVDELTVAQGDTVEAGALLVRIIPEGASHDL